MKTFIEAKESIRRQVFNEEERARSQRVHDAAEKFLEVLWGTTQPNAELTLASRSVEQAVMWHSKSIATEAKKR